MLKKFVLFVTVLGTLSLVSGSAWAVNGEGGYIESESAEKTVVNLQSQEVVQNRPENFISRKDREKEEKKFPEAKQVKEKYRPQMLQIKASLKELKGKVAKELTSENPNKATVKNYMNQMVELRRKQQMLLVDQMFETLDMLPKEKRADYIQPIVEHCLR